MKLLLPIFTAFVLVLVSCSAPDKDVKKGYSFLVAGHVYGTPIDSTQPIPVGLYPPFKSKLKELTVDSTYAYLFLNGDIVQNANAETWRAVEQDLAGLSTQVVYVAGNHDYYGDSPIYPMDELTYSSFTHQGDLFILLDGMLNGWSIRGKQYAFLKQTMAQVEQESSKPDNIFILTHHALWSDSSGRYKDYAFNSIAHREEPVNFYDSILPLFSEVPSDVYFICGDMGAIADQPGYMDEKYSDHIRFLGSGMGGKTDDNILQINRSTDGKVSMHKISLTSKPL